MVATFTENYQIPLPDPEAEVDDEFYRLQQAWTIVDTVIWLLAEAVAQKANVSHTHAMSAIGGLVEALAAKMPADRTFSLDDLTDVSGADGAANNYVLVKNASGQWVPSSAIAALGPHQHATGDIVGLAAVVNAAVAAVVGAAPTTLDTVAEVATALGNDPNFATTIMTLLGQKAAKTDVYTKAEVDALTAIPIGTVIDVYGNGTTAIPGFLKVVAGLEVTNAYPQLRAFGLANGWAVNGSGNPVMPSGDALFKRGWTAGQTRDPGRTFGSVQTDAFQGHNFGDPTAPSTAKLGTFLLNVTGGAVSVAGLRADTSPRAIPVDDGTNGAPRTASETRVANMTVTYYIKAYGASVDAGTLAAAQVLNDLTDARARIAALERKFSSTPLTPTLGGLIQAPHNLGVKPTYYEAYAVCTSQEFNFQVDNEIRVTTNHIGSTAGYGVMVWADATNIYGRIGNTAIGLTFNLSTGAAITLTLTSWKIVLRAKP
ncbi:Hypothetical protein RG1141_CH24250 [Neorhizobium galegae bv. officinalis bv. officinalis str. HAMBI 1141]|uniref:Tail fiber protein n=1 Tax=Neorhizobium galegae bv. officinalis bv. officinalis str. HAMBI 1141 TaxID=1028801 RepID=A0A068T8H6_NEOGA|nr:hypothetical protein [Neorhizobium galegae]CDN54763.1 Hypothetical protein RG1141_CH24250 [Neorhizobium galegae bv. officinalis bv. officinalis str. HAMBI 1141]